MTRRRFFQLITLLLVPPIIFAGVVIYVKLFGFRKALEELVDQGTEGRYALTFEESSVDIRHLTFTFSGLSIQRNPGIVSTPIRQVWIPSMKIDFASLPKMLAIDKIRIKSLTIVEPEIQADALGASGKNQRLAGELQLTQQLVRLYPAIESLLGQFDITSLSVTRASLELRRSRSSLKLNMIDLLIEHWNVEHLTDKSQLLLRVDGQGIDLGKAEVDFGSIEFNFQQHHLLFSDFKLLSTDSVSGSHVSVAGHSILLEKLDYKELYDNQRFVLQRAQIDNPTVEARFRLKQNRSSAVKDRSLVVRLLKQVIGECYIDSTIINNARVKLTLQQEKESFTIDLPEVDFKLHGFGVSDDSTTFQVGGIETSLHKTSINLKNQMSVSCEKIYFDANRDVTFTDLAVADAGRGEIARVGKIHIEAFDALAFIFNKAFYAGRIAIENTALRITPRNRSASKSHSSNRIRELGVTSVSLRNVDLTYTDPEGLYSAQGVSVNFGHVRYDTLSRLSYEFETIQVASASAELPAQGLDATIKRLRTDGIEFRIGELAVQKDSMHFKVNDLIAIAANKVTSGEYNNWKSAEILNLEVWGILPERSRDSVRKTTLPSFVLDQIKVDKFQTRIAAKQNTLRISGNHIAADHLSNDSTGIHHGTVSGAFHGLEFNSLASSLTADSVLLGYPQSTQFQKIHFVKGDLEILLGDVTALHFAPGNGLIAVEELRTRNFRMIRQHRMTFDADSLLVRELGISPSDAPSVALVEVFHPTITMQVGQRQRGRQFAGTLPRNIVLHPGKLILANQHEIDFGELRLDRDNHSFTCEQLKTSFRKSDLTLSGITVTPDFISMDTLALIARRQWYDTCKMEDTQVTAKLYQVKATGHSIDSMLRSGKFHHVAVTIGNFDLLAHRDKRMTDAPAREKPLTLEQLVRLPPSIQIRSVAINDGRIHYSEVSDKTGEEGWIGLENTSALLTFDSITSLASLKAKTKLYDAGLVDLSYRTLDSCTFQLSIHATNLDLPRFNNIILPLEAVRIKSGTVKEFNLNITADSALALGRADITYRKLHLQIFKRGAPEKKTLGTELLSLVADKVVLRHKREKAPADVRQPRIKHKSIFNFWVKSAVNGATGAIRGKKR